MFTKGEGTKEVRSKIRVYYRVFMVRSSDDVFLLTQKNTREKYTLSLSLTQRKEGKKGATTQSPGPFLLSRSLIAFRGVVFAKVVMGVTDVKVHTF